MSSPVDLPCTVCSADSGQACHDEQFRPLSETNVERAKLDEVVETKTGSREAALDLPVTQGDGPPAGWYDHPTMVNTRRYWDGSAWTGDLSEKVADDDSEEEDDYTEEDAELDLWLLKKAEDADAARLFWPGVLVAFLLPLAGFVMGIYLWTRSPKYGTRLIIGSIGLTMLYAKLLLG